MKISRSCRPLRTEYFATSTREVTSGITLAYTDTIPDERIDAHALDHIDVCKSYFGCTYHYLIKPSGEVEIGRDPRTNTSRGNQALAAVNILIGIIGGRNEEGDHVTTITPAQRAAAEELMQALAETLQSPLELTDWVEDKALRDQRHQEEQAEAQQEERLDQLEAMSSP